MSYRRGKTIYRRRRGYPIDACVPEAKDDGRIVVDFGRYTLEEILSCIDERLAHDARSTKPITMIAAEMVRDALGLKT